MSGAPTPPLLSQPIAVDAGGSFITNPMPPTPPGSPANAASISDGFPPITMQSVLAGGLPPNGQDMNGFLFLISSHTLYVECGQLYQYNATLAGDIGGYAAGTVLGMLDGTGMWLNISDGNSTDPDTGGAGWVPLNSYGFTTLSGLTGGTVNPTGAQTKYSVIVLTGNLISNLTINLPQTLQQWLIINHTTGAFSTTVKTAAGGSSGVTIPQAGYTAPTGVYSVGDGNIYPTVAPLSVPISQAATPLTLVERTSAGYVFGVYFNSNTSLENPALGAIFVQNAAADGYMRKMSVANFCAAIASTLFASAALTGNPTAPTQAPGNSSTRIATTAFANPAGAILAASGSIPLPSGHIIKYGSFALPSSGAAAVNFASAFPNNCWSVVPSQGDSAGYGYPFGVDTISKTGFVTGAAVGGITSGTGYYIAIGN